MQNVEVLDSRIESQNASPTAWWRRRPSRRTTIIALAVAGTVAGLFFGWNWAVAAGLSSFVLGLLPCAAMCAAGLCMNRMGQKSACGKIGVPESAPQPGESPPKAISVEGGAPPLENGIAVSEDQLPGH